ncbi:MAG: LacI family transcriptional regulator [Clostridiales bacterium]|nr:LacI family transcriptional regulator [Clostridiales bacterium]
MEYVFDSTDMHRKEINLTQKQQSRLFNKYVEKCIDEYERLNDKPSAICCVNDRSMHAFFDAATKRGIRIPEDLTLTGFDYIDDDNDFISSHGIISVKQNFFEMGATAMRLILKILNDQSYLMNELINGTLITNTQ